MERHTGKCRNNWLIAVESRKEQHEEIIQSTVAKRAYELFEQRGCEHGFDLDDWISAEKELLMDDFSGDTSAYHLFIECPRNPDVTTVLSLTTLSLVVLHSHTSHLEKTDIVPDVVSVHVLPEEIDPAEAKVYPVDGLLHVHVPKKNHTNQSWS
jgi:hypothetical protein